jgi:hypothetical protein
MSLIKSFLKQREQNYIEEAHKKFEESLKPIAAQVLKLILEDSSDDAMILAIKALAKRSHRIYNNLVDELGAEERHNEAEAAGEVWRKGLTNHALETLRAMGYKL